MFAPGAEEALREIKASMPAEPEPEANASETVKDESAKDELAEDQEVVEPDAKPGLTPALPAGVSLSAARSLNELFRKTTVQRWYHCTR